MTRDSLVAINIVDKDDVLHNPTSVPILFYWNGEDKLEDHLVENKEFKNFIAEETFTAHYYTKTSINFFFFTYDEQGEEKYTENKLDIQDLFLMKDMSEQESIFYYNYLKKYFNKLYENAFKEKYEWGNESNPDTALKDMFSKIQSLHPDRFSLESLSNYIRLQLQRHDNMNSQNIDFVLEKLKYILTSFTL